MTDRRSLAPRISWVWPGLPGLWLQGRWPDVAVAVVCSNLLVLGILTTFVWPELLPTTAWAVVCFGVAATWLALAFRQIRRESRPANDLRSGAERRHLFRAAQTEYLRGNWFQAETTLTRLLAAEAGDVEARLLLATLLRRVKQRRSAEDQLNLMEQSRTGTSWRFEIANERRLLALIPEGQAGDLRESRAPLAGEAA